MSDLALSLRKTFRIICRFGDLRRCKASDLTAQKLMQLRPRDSPALEGSQSSCFEVDDLDPSRIDRDALVSVGNRPPAGALHPFSPKRPRPAPQALSKLFSNVHTTLPTASYIPTHLGGIVDECSQSTHPLTRLDLISPSSPSSLWLDRTPGNHPLLTDLSSIPPHPTNLTRLWPRQ
jgi:hypothetical protein